MKKILILCIFTICTLNSYSQHYFAEADGVAFRSDWNNFDWNFHPVDVKFSIDFDTNDVAIVHNGSRVDITISEWTEEFDGELNTTFMTCRDVDGSKVLISMLEIISARTTVILVSYANAPKSYLYNIYRIREVKR